MKMERKREFGISLSKKTFENEKRFLTSKANGLTNH